VVTAEHAVSEAVKGADPQMTCGLFQQAFDAAAHFRRRLVGESHRERPVGRERFGRDHPGDAPRQDARLAAARARKHQHRARRRGYGRALGVVQSVENQFFLHHAILAGGSWNKPAA
jgi:hypothetical protein